MDLYRELKPFTPHEDLGRSRWFYAQWANLHRRGKCAGFSIPVHVTMPNLRDLRRNRLIVVQTGGTK